MDAQGGRGMKEVEEVNAPQRTSSAQRQAPVSPAKGAQGTADLALLLQGSDLTHIAFTSHRRWLGPLVVLAKKGLSRLLTPILERQTAYNAANARLIASLKDEFSALWAATHLQPTKTSGQGASSHAPQTVPPTSSWRADNLPTQPDDPRLDQWYHTIDLGNGLTTRGIFDHRPVVQCYGLPESLEGKTCLDVGTGDGFFAFEMERRGAARVVAIDISRCEDFDLLPQIRPRLLLADEGPHRFKFQLAHAMRRSRVEFKLCNVYDLSPETVGMFDVVFCGSMLLHLQNPLKALSNIRSVTREMAIIETLVNEELEEKFPGKPWLSFGIRHVELFLGENCVYWGFTTKALEDMLAYAGFAETQPQKLFRLPPPEHLTTAVVAYTRPRGGH
jgi:2-polyprenyl-3-methyl-5-hydroxy-6-metoxy-1,4-benzoquinol methylase